MACSPPFLRLRDYSTDGQWGQEPTPADYLTNLLRFMEQARRVITPTGSVVVEIGDSYSGAGISGGDYKPDRKKRALNDDDKDPTRRRGASADRWASSDSQPGWPLAKSLTGVPTLFAWSLAYGHNMLNPAETFPPWRIRNLIVWARANPPVGRLGDKFRPATSYIVVATINKRRWFDLDAVRVHKERRASRGVEIGRGRTTPDGGRRSNRVGYDRDWDPTRSPPTDYWDDEYDGDMTWLVNAQPSKVDHYAMWPTRLADRIVRSMCPAKVCRVCREPARPHQPEWVECGHGDWRPGVVFDPFCGAGTTLAVADLRGRDAIGSDLDRNVRRLYDQRYGEVAAAIRRMSST